MQRVNQRTKPGFDYGNRKMFAKSFMGSHILLRCQFFPTLYQGIPKLYSRFFPVRNFLHLILS